MTGGLAKNKLFVQAHADAVGMTCWWAAGVTVRQTSLAEFFILHMMLRTKIESE